MKTHTRLFTHTDLDGTGVVIVAKELFGEDLYWTGHGYNTSLRDIVAYLDTVDTMTVEEREQVSMLRIVIADLSFSEKDGSEMAERLDKLNAQDFFEVMFVDHHETSTWLSKYSWATIDTENCATRILYDAFITANEPLHEFVMQVDAFDAWKLTSPYRDAGEALDQLYSFADANMFMYMYEEAHGDMSKYSMINAVLKAKLYETVDRAAKSALDFRVEIGETTLSVGVLFLYMSKGLTYANFSAVSSMLRAGYDVLIGVNIATDSVSVRSTDIDMLPFVEQVGGGGHHQSCGFPIPPELEYVSWKTMATPLLHKLFPGAKISMR